MFDDNEKWAVPMVCFCDIPLSNISQHITKYGGYAIGIKKDWAKGQGVSPIMYVHEKTPVIEKSRVVLEKLLNDEKNVLRHNIWLQSLSFFQMIKPYEGVQEIDGVETKVRYYDEREWRYIPPLGKEFVDIMFEERGSDKYDECDRLNEKYGVSFEPDVINYIIVQKEAEIVPLIQDIMRIKGKYSFDSVQRLVSRILSVERILEDF